MIKIFFRNLSRAFQYAKFGWNNPDFDSHYLLELMQWKLNRMATHIENHNTIEEANELAGEIGASKHVLQRILDDNYYDSAIAQHEQKYGLTAHWFEECEKKHETYGTMYACKSKRMDKGIPNKEAEKDFSNTFKRANKLRQKDLDLVFNYIAKNCQKWWD